MKKLTPPPENYITDICPANWILWVQVQKVYCVSFSTCHFWSTFVDFQLGVYDLIGLATGFDSCQAVVQQPNVVQPVNGKTQVEDDLDGTILVSRGPLTPLRKSFRSNLVGSFKYLFIFTPSWGNDPIWLICFNWVETTNSKWFWGVFCHLTSGGHHFFPILCPYGRCRSCKRSCRDFNNSSSNW